MPTHFLVGCEDTCHARGEPSFFSAEKCQQCQLDAEAVEPTHPADSLPNPALLATAGTAGAMASPAVRQPQEALQEKGIIVPFPCCMHTGEAIGLLASAPSIFSSTEVRAFVSGRAAQCRGYDPLCHPFTHLFCPPALPENRASLVSGTLLFCHQACRTCGEPAPEVTTDPWHWKCFMAPFATAAWVVRLCRPCCRASDWGLSYLMSSVIGLKTSSFDLMKWGL